MRCSRHDIYTFFAGLVFSACLSLSSAVRADDGYAPVYKPEVRISKATGPIDVDGALEDAGWRGAVKIGNFAEHNPGDQTKPEVDTEVMVAYDEKNLYVAWICYDDPSQVRASFCERDNIFTGDYVILCIDPFGDASIAYEIAANPYGIPGDLFFSANYGEDAAYDMIFESAGRMTEDGWVVEMAIPFAGMRFPAVAEQVWKMDFWRNRPRGSRFQYSWAAYDRDESCWPCQWGTVTGISGIESGSGLELLPSIVAHQSGRLRDDGEFVNDELKGDLSLGISYDISSELTAEATINPDFSQVESDIAQLDVNSTFALFYPERRPFFMEGSDLFNTLFNAVYTRQINDPLLAGKLTWRKGSNSVAFLTAHDEHSVIILPFEERSAFIENGKSYSNIVRVKHEFGEQSHIGLIATDRRFEGGGSGSLFGVDGKIRFSPNNSMVYQFLSTHTGEVDNPALADSAFNATRFDGDKYTAGLDGETFQGYGWVAGLSRDKANYSAAASYVEVSPTFRADNGFETSNNWRRLEFELQGIKHFEESRILENITGSVNTTRKWNFDGVRKDEWVNANLETKFRAGQTGIHSSYMASDEQFRGIQFNEIWQAHTCFNTRPFDALALGGNVNYGHRIARRELVMGKETSWGIWADIKPIDRMLIETSFSNIRSDDLKTDERLFSQSIFWSRLTLQISRELSLRFVSQYNDRYRCWDVDPLVTYRVNSLSMFYFGSTHDYRDLDFEEDGMEGWKLTDRQFFIKFQYLFQV